MDHAKIWSPSSSDRLITCPGSYLFTKDMPDTSSAASMEGSTAHDLAEMTLKSSGKCLEFNGYTFPKYDNWVVTGEMCAYVQRYVDAVGAKIINAHSCVSIENRVDISEWAPGQFGTNDFSCIMYGMRDSLVLHVDDLKYGKGVPVGAKENRQLMTYGLGVYGQQTDEIKARIKKVRLTIHQPRLDSTPTWTCDVSELLKHGEVIRETWPKLFDPNAPKVASHKGCMFCKGKKGCSTYAQFLVDGRPKPPKVAQDNTWALNLMKQGIQT